MSFCFLECVLEGFDRIDELYVGLLFAYYLVIMFVEDKPIQQAVQYKGFVFTTQLLNTFDYFIYRCIEVKHLYIKY